MDVQSHLSLFSAGSNSSRAENGSNTHRNTEEVKTSPLFSAKVWEFIERQRHPHSPHRTKTMSNPYSHYGLIGLRVETYGRAEQSRTDQLKKVDNLIYANINAPWSTFICGSQGSGKSHTLSCLLENALIHPSAVGQLPNPLGAIVFHYDKFTGTLSSQLCEAAYLCSAGIPVKVLVSPTNFKAMKEAYHSMPGLPAGAPRPEVIPMFFQDKHLNISIMKTLMAVGGGSGQTPLYMEVVTKVLREMARDSQGLGLDYQVFKRRLEFEHLLRGQGAPLRMRLGLLESFLEKTAGGIKEEERGADLWACKSGTLTIVDLSCPFVGENDACALFNICLSLFLERRHGGGRLVALDEAHKFLIPNSGEALEFTNSLLAVIRQQRHLATRVVIATQEPTVSPALLDLCNTTIVHRFSSPAWFKMLESHLAAALIRKRESGKEPGEDLFNQIVNLATGEALVFCPKAMLDIVPIHETSVSTEGDKDSNDSSDDKDDDEIAGFGGLSLGNSSYRSTVSSVMSVQELGASYIRMKIRKRITADGGRSILVE